MQNKTFLCLATAFAFSLLASPNYAGTFNQAPGKQATQGVVQNKGKAQTAEFKITGMTCNACSSKVTKAVNTMPGILNANVSHENGNAIVEFDKSKTSVEELKKAIASSGFKVTEAKVKQ
jgi:mercuric ion transport protein